MITRDLVRDIENASYRCWQAGEVVEYDGWQLRFADGFSRRGNSVYPGRKGTLDHRLKLDWCRRWYEERDLDLVVRQTPASEEGLDDLLAGAGFGREGSTDVMWGSLGGATTSSIPVVDGVTSVWLDAMASLWNISPGQLPGWRAIIDRIDLPAGYAVLVGDDDAPIAAGLGVVADEWLGLFEIVVAESWRRRGIGRAVTEALLGWGGAEGATRAFLQVVADNRPAIALYQQLGFQRGYTYWYRRAPRISSG